MIGSRVDLSSNRFISHLVFRDMNSFIQSSIGSFIRCGIGAKISNSSLCAIVLRKSIRNDDLDRSIGTGGLKSWLNRTDDVLNHRLELGVTLLSLVVDFDGLKSLVGDNLWHRNILSFILDSVGQSIDIQDDWLWFWNDN